MLVFVLGKFLVSPFMRKIHRAAEGTVGHCWGETVYTSATAEFPLQRLSGSCCQLLEFVDLLLLYSDCSSLCLGPFVLPSV